MKNRIGFTLTEDATHTNMLLRVSKGFTLAEVLITLAIIGVVAALTIPTLIVKINEKVIENQTAVFNAKLIKGLNLTKSAGDLNNTYSSTVDFLQNGLGKHLKIAKICDSSHMRECVPYDKITYSPDGTTEDSIEVSKFNTSKKLNKKAEDGFKDISSFVLADGTVVIASYNQNCLVDDGELDKEINSCFAGIYDLNGTRKPNKLGKDLQPFNGAGINMPVVLATLGGVKIISAAEVPTPVSCSDYIGKEGFEVITACHYNNNNDRVVGAIKKCQEAGGRLPTDVELAAMASELYGVTIEANESKPSITLDMSKIPTPLSGLGSSWDYLWSSYIYPLWGANIMGYYRDFNRNYSDFSRATRDLSSVKAVCVMD